VSPPQHQEVRSFGTTTRELFELADWLESHGCTHVAMEATGVYWKPIWHVLEERFELVLGNAQHIRNVPGRKTDVNDATLDRRSRGARLDPLELRASDEHPGAARSNADT
jgi:transposase